MTTVSTGTPVISVTDNRGLAVRTLNWNRTTAGGETTLLVTHALTADDTRTSAFRDPRLFAAWQTDDTTGANLTTFSSLAGQSLRRDSTDSGQNITVYDAEGRPAWARDPAGTVMTWAYDELGRTTSTLQQPAGTTETVTAAAFVYGDNDPQTVNPQDNNLRGVCVRRYDEGGLLTTDNVALSGAVLSTSQTFLLDAESLPDWPGDEAGRSALLESTTYTTTAQADALGRTVSQTDASGHAVSMTYDVSGVPVTQALQLKDQPATPLLTGMTLSAAGQVLSEVAGNGVTTTYNYEEDTLRLSGIAAVRTGDSTVLQSLGYTYDPVGNVTTVSDTTVSAAWFRNQATDGTRSFTYDAMYQLLSATGRENAANGPQTSALPAMQSPDDSQTVNYTRSYSYDNSGNLTTMTHTGAVSSTMTLVTDNSSNRSVRQNKDNSLTPDMDWSQWFTPGGQLKTLQTEGGKPAAGYTDSADPLTWDRNTWLQGVTLVSRSSTDATQNDREVYQYRGGMRVRKQTRTLTNSTSGLWTVSEVRYLPGLEVRNSWQETVTNGSPSDPAYSEQLEVVTTQAGRSQIRALHWVTTPPEGISNGQIRYGVDDNIGSMQLELDNTGQIISREEYYPYGGTAVWAGRSQVEADYKTVRYSGQERDGTGLYYYGYRYYAPWLCRWTASDPGGEIDGLNLFRMVRNNPVTMRDVDGRLSTQDILIALTAISIVVMTIYFLMNNGKAIEEKRKTEHESQRQEELQKMVEASIKNQFQRNNLPESRVDEYEAFLRNSAYPKFGLNFSTLIIKEGSKAYFYAVPNSARKAVSEAISRKTNINTVIHNNGGISREINLGRDEHKNKPLNTSSSTSQFDIGSAAAVNKKKSAGISAPVETALISPADKKTSTSSSINKILNPEFADKYDSDDKKHILTAFEKVEEGYGNVHKLKQGKLDEFSADLPGFRGQQGRGKWRMLMVREPGGFRVTRIADTH